MSGKDSNGNGNGFPWWHRDLRSRVSRLEKSVDEYDKVFAVAEKRSEKQSENRKAVAGRVWEVVRFIVYTAIGALAALTAK